MRKFLLYSSIVAITACGEMPDYYASKAATDGIVNGTRDPQNTFLTAGEILSVVYLADLGGWEYCSGTLVHPRVVVTAQHCTQGESPGGMLIGFGVNPRSPDATIQVAAIHEHSWLDFSMIVLGTSATSELPTIEPIAMNRDPVNSSWVGRWVDAAGYGDTYSSTSGRFFASVQIDGYDSALVDVDGHSLQGICYGDSGGPILWQPDAGTPPVVVGAESYGDASCVDHDHLSRVDVGADWVDGIIAAGLPPEQIPCGGVDSIGSCQANHAVYCDNGYLQDQDCGYSGLTCGFLGPSVGYRCLAASCGTLDFYGECNGDQLRWCGTSGLRTQDCTADGLSCVFVDAATGFDCGGCPMCNGVCTDLATSLQHCGACNDPCSIPNAQTQCNLGNCLFVACNPNFSNDDGTLANGCEVGPPPGLQYYNDGTKTDGGCGCRSSGAGAWSVVGLFGLVLWRRRRRSPGT